MTISSKLMLASSLLAVTAVTASAQPGATPSSDETAAAEAEADAALRPPSAVEVAPTVYVAHKKPSPLATTERWGGGVRLTGLSGIGALPGVNYGGEVAGNVRHDELFAEFALGRWRPQKTYVVTESPQRVELGLDVWTLRGGWASMSMPLRLWGLVEVGELASAGMPGVVARMMTGEVPDSRRWRAVGAGFGVAWPMSNNARFVGMIEIAVPVDRGTVMLDTAGAYRSDPMAARSSAGLEVGWR